MASSHYHNMNKIFKNIIITLITILVVSSVAFPVTYHMMRREDYDADNNTIVDNAEEVGSLSTTGIVKRTAAETYSTVTDSSADWDTAYTHSQDNTQAHTDYLLNNAADLMSAATDGTTELIIRNTDGVLAAETYLLELQHTDDGSVNGDFIKATDAYGGTPATLFNVEYNGDVTSAGTIEGATLTEGGNAVYNATEVPGGELGGTWASPTIDDLFVLNSASDTMTGDLTLNAQDPALILDGSTALDTDYWLGVTADEGGDDDDLFQIGDGTTKGTNPFLTINTSGNVGIGTTNPANKLDVNGTVIVSDAGNTRWTITGGVIMGDISGPNIERSAGSSTFPTYAFRNDANTGMYSPSADEVRFATNASDRVTINSTGNVGIGTTNPAQDLDIVASGSIGFAGTAILSDSAGTMTLSNVDAIDATTETTLESAIDIAGEVTGTGLGSVAIADGVAVANWDLTTPTITTSLTTSTPTTLSAAELDRLDGLAGIIATDVTAVTDLEGTGLSITAGTLNVGGLTSSELATNSVADDEIDYTAVTSTDLTFDADTVNRTAVYNGTSTSLEETTGATDSGAYIVGAFDEFAFSAGTDVQTVLDDLDAAIPDYYQYTLLPSSAILDDGSPPAITIIESTGTGTPRFRVAQFDAATDEIIYWTFVVPDDMNSGNWLLEIIWFSNDIGANETCFWGAQLSATTEGDVDDMEEQAAGTAVTASEDVNTTEADRMISTTLTLNQLDSVAAGDIVTLRFYRDADNASDDLTSDAELVAVRLKIPRT